MFFSCLLLALLLSCLLLALHLSCLLLALLFRFFASFLALPVPFSFFDSAGRFARVLRTCSSAHSGQSAVASFQHLVTTGTVGRGFSVLCLTSLAAHRDLSYLCAARPLLRAARSSSVNFTTPQFTTPWFASGLLQHHYSALRHFLIVGSR